MISLLLAVLLVQEAEVLPVAEQPGAVCSNDEDCNCFQQMDTYTWAWRPCPEPIVDLAPVPEAPAQTTLYEPPVEDTLKDPQVSVVGGATVALDTFGAASKASPFASVMVDWLLAGRQRHLDAFVQADYTGLPDAQVTLASAAEFNAFMVEMGLTYRPSEEVSASLYGGGGFASRFAEGTQEPHTSAPLWSSFGVAFRDRGDSRARLRIGIGADERLGYGWTLAAHVKGSIRLTGIGDSRIGVTLLADAILGLEAPAGRDQRINIINLSAGMSWDSK